MEAKQSKINQHELYLLKIPTALINLKRFDQVLACISNSGNDLVEKLRNDDDDDDSDSTENE